jgi:diphosphomevalonate decarboxylase
MVTVFAPVNIAWVKYMGKENGAPTNASFSMTLSDLGTETQIRCLDSDASLAITFRESPYQPPKTGIEKAERFLLNLEPFRAVLMDAGFEVAVDRGLFGIKTQNNIPAGTGIATSASGYAALTLGWFGILVGKDFSRFKSKFEVEPEFRAKIARVAALGSGSACRSFHGPFVEWGQSGEVSRVLGGPTNFVDFVLILESGVKEVSSSEAHLRVKTSPLFEGRVKRAQDRLIGVKSALARGSISELATLVREESSDMHELFHTSKPPFRYQKEESKAWLERIKNKEAQLPSENAIFTMDAGANVHLFVPENEANLWFVILRRNGQT